MIIKLEDDEYHNLKIEGVERYCELFPSLSLILHQHLLFHFFHNRSVSTKKSVLVSNGMKIEPDIKSSLLIVKYPGPPSIAALEELIKFMETGEFQPTMDNIEHLIYVTVSFEWEMESALKILLDFLHGNLAKRNPGQTDRKIILMFVRFWKDFEYCVNRIGYKSPLHRMIPVNALGQENEPFKIVLSPPRFIYAGFQSIMFEKCVLDLGVNYMRWILDAQILNITEEDVLKTIKMWINHDYDARKQHFPDLIRCMRYDENMRIDFIVEQLLCGCKVACDCLTAKDYVVAILGQRNGYTGDVADAGPRNKEKRPGCKYWKNQEPIEG